MFPICVCTWPTPLTQRWEAIHSKGFWTLLYQQEKHSNRFTNLRFNPRFYHQLGKLLMRGERAAPSYSPFPASLQSMAPARLFPTPTPTPTANTRSWQVPLAQPACSPSVLQKRWGSCQRRGGGERRKQMELLATPVEKKSCPNPQPKPSV